MKLYFDYSDHAHANFNKGALADLAQETLKNSRFEEFLDGRELTLDVAVVDEVEIQRVNREYRSKDAVTDVISVGEYSDDHDLAMEKSQKIFLGEVVLCWSDIQNNATIQHTEDAYEFAYVFTHGILHLLGYEHSKEMFDLQDQLSKQFYRKLH